MDQHGRTALAISQVEIRQMKDAERRDKSERRDREGHEFGARTVKTFREVGDIKKDTADL